MYKNIVPRAYYVIALSDYVQNNPIFCFFGTWSSSYSSRTKFFNTGDYDEFEAKLFGDNAHKISYIWLLT